MSKLNTLASQFGRMTLFAALLTAALGAPLPAAAAPAPATSAAVPKAPDATIFVNGTTCTLANAIKAANTDAPAGGCPAGSGADVLSLAAGATFTLTVADNATDGGNGLPVISSTVTIDGNGATIARDPHAASFRLLDVSSAGALTVNNLTLRGGNLFGAGGALWAHSFVTLTNVSLIANGAVIGGAVALNAGGWISGSTFFGNGAVQIGGGLSSNGSGPVSLTNVIFQQNTSTGNGGGADSEGDALTIVGGAFISNTASTSGGGLESASTALTLTNVTFSRNSAGDSGGGVDNAFGTAQVTGATFNGNLAVNDGAGFNNMLGQATFTNDTFSGNSSSGNGGGLENNGGHAGLTSVTLSGNTAAFGGGLYQDGGTQVQNSLTLTGTIVANSVLGGDCYVSPSSFISITSGDHNLASDTSCNVDFTQPHDQKHVAPLLGLLQNNGGPTLTLLPAANSPAVDAGGAVCPATDQRGVARPQGPACDIGSVERRPNEASVFLLYLPLVRK